MIRQCHPGDTGRIYFIINEAARAYEGEIPPDCYHQPYMPMEEMEQEIKRVTFFGWEADGELVGIMGIEPIKDVTLIRHAYVLSQWQKQGIGRQAPRAPQGSDYHSPPADRDLGGRPLGN
ncbi:GNAT family N-acetyltransferase [Chloroflexota bacterium]